MTVADVMRVFNFFLTVWSTIFLVSLIRDMIKEYKDRKKNKRSVSKLLLFLFISLLITSTLSGAISLVAFLSSKEIAFCVMKFNHISRVRSVFANLAIFLSSYAFWRIKGLNKYV